MSEKRIEELRVQVRHHREQYYNNTPEISDADFDLLEDELRQLSPFDEVFKEVGAGVSTSSWEKVNLPFEAGSLNKAMTIHEFKEWVRRTGYTGSYVVSAKLDGASSIETWKAGSCKQVATRGDSKVGENVTTQFPESVTVADGFYRAECVISKKVFETHLLPKGYKNARNSASSLMRSPNASREDIKTLDRVYYFKQGDFKTEMEMWEQIEADGLKTTFHKLCKDVEEVAQVFNQFESVGREEFPYEIDGLVVVMNDRVWHDRLGSHGGRPKYALAIKFAPKRVETVILDVEWSLGDSGKFVPVAKVHPVSDGYATIQNVNLHNIDFIRSKRVQIGSKVSIARSGDVIPYLYEVLS